MTRYDALEFCSPLIYRVLVYAVWRMIAFTGLRWMSRSLLVSVI